MPLVPNAVGGSGSGPILRKFSTIYSHLVLKPVFAGLKLTKKLLYKYEHLTFTVYRCFNLRVVATIFPKQKET